MPTNTVCSLSEGSPLPKGGGRIETKHPWYRRPDDNVPPCRKAGGGLKQQRRISKRPDRDSSPLPKGGGRIETASALQ